MSFTLFLTTLLLPLLLLLLLQSFPPRTRRGPCDPLQQRQLQGAAGLDRDNFRGQCFHCCCCDADWLQRLYVR